MHKGKNVEQDSIMESAFLYYYQEKQSSWCSKLNYLPNVLQRKSNDSVAKKEQSQKLNTTWKAGNSSIKIL